MRPSTTGALADRPIAHLLVYALERQLNGTLEVTDAAESESASIVLRGGEVAKIRTSANVVYLGPLLHELGFIDDVALNASLFELAKGGKLLGQILRSREAVTAD